MRARWGVAAPLAGLLAAVGLLVAARGLDEVAREGQLGPGFWPRLVLIGLGLACVAKAAVEWRGRRAGGSEVVGAGLGGVRGARLLGAAALIVLYVALTPVAGFPLATAGFIAAFMWVAGGRSPLGLGLGAGGGTVVLLYVFIKLVYLPLPKGNGPFEAVTLALYRALGIF